MTTVRLGRILPRRAGFAALLALPLLAACASPAVDGSARSPEEGPVDTGTVPNLNIQPEAAATQFTPQEARAKLAALKASGHNTGNWKGDGGPSAAELARLKRIAASHGDETLKAIEGK